MSDSTSHMAFPTPGMRILSALVQFLGVSILAHCVSRRVLSEDLTSLQGWRDMTWPRLCILLMFLDSWLFLFTSGIIIFGVGLEQGAVCSAAIYLCIAFYNTSKIFLYCFLIEKVHLVWASTTHTKRIKSPIYILCCVIVSLYAAVVAVLLIGRIHFIRDDGVCVIGLHLFAAVPLLTYDLLVNIFLTAMFLWPLLRTGKVNPRLRKVAMRTLVASVVALTTSTVNILILAILHGQELGWVCLGSCGADVIFNACALFWVTERSRSGQNTSSIKVRSNGLPAPNDRVDEGYGSKPISVLPVSSSDMNGPITPSSDTKGGYLSRYGTGRKGDARVSFTGDNTHRPSVVRLGSTVKSPWALESMTGYFRNEDQRDEVQMQVKITTDSHELVDEPILSPITTKRFSDQSMPKDMESSHHSSEIGR